MTKADTIQNLIRHTVKQLEVPDLAERASITALEKTIAAHDQKLLSMACMTAVETGDQQAVQPILQFPFNVTAWNLERCLFAPQSAQKMLAEQPAIALLSEIDNGMARTKQRNMAAELAGLMQMNYAYGVEYIELGLGSQIEHQFCDDDFNAKGFHGNALLANAAMQQIFIQRLYGECLWFMRGGDQPRLGERNAIGAVFTTEAGPFVAVSLHLESAASAQYREQQVAGLIKALDQQFGDMPVLIGGDLNTGLQHQGDFEAEPLFATARDAGFSRHSGALEQPTLHASLISPAPQYPLKLDWFLTRGLIIGESRIISSYDADGLALSDHDLIMCRVEGFSR